MTDPSNNPITVALVEDDERISRTLAMILDDAADCRCVGQYRRGEEAVAAIPAQAPRVIIMDVNLPGINGRIDGDDPRIAAALDLPGQRSGTGDVGFPAAERI